MKQKDSSDSLSFDPQYGNQEVVKLKQWVQQTTI